MTKPTKGWGHKCKGKWRYLFTDECRYCGRKKDANKIRKKNKG
jgi:hypothetical protein